MRLGGNPLHEIGNEKGEGIGILVSYQEKIESKT